MTTSDTSLLRVMCFNILTDNCYTRLLDYRHGRHKRFEQLARILLNSGCDVIGLQECTPGHWRRFTKTLSARYNTYAVPSDGADSGETCPVLWDRKRFTTVQTGTFWINNTLAQYQKVPNAKRIRICSWVKLQDQLSDNNEFTVFNTHFDHAKDDAGHKVRTISAGIVLGQMQILGGSRTILIGDLNFHPGEPAYGVLANALTDCGKQYYLAAGDWPVTYHGWGSQYAGCIDYIFCSPNWTVGSYHVDNGNAPVPKTYPSDHFPLIAGLR